MNDLLATLGVWSAAAAAAFYLAFLITWVLYLAIMNLAARRSQMHWFTRLNAYLLLAIGYPVDAIFNVLASLVLFQRPPKKWLFTGTLQWWQDSEDRRRARWANLICKHLLDPFDPKGKHC